MNAIQIAYNGRIDMLKAIFGGGGDDPPPASPAKTDLPKMTPQMFGAMFNRG